MPNAASCELVNGRLVERNSSIGSSLVTMRFLQLLGTEAYRTGEADVFSADLGYQCFTDDPNRIRKPDASVVARSA